MSPFLRQQFRVVVRQTWNRNDLPKMIRDPLYRDITNRLDGPLHEEAFERCAQDLLRKIYPTLVPVRGGRDGGMDGVTADLRKSQIVLISTVGEEVKRNLESSLKSMLKNANPCRRVISATSQKLSPEKQKELREAAGGLGFRLVQIYERAGMSDLLYESPKWCKELLNLTGDPPPLSIIPRSGRPTITDVLIGRDRDARWLIESSGNRLLVGQPGSGKTFLTTSLAKQNDWLFVVTDDLGQIANGIRSQKPAALVLDDADVETNFLLDITRLLNELDADIPLIVTCWPGAADHVAQALNLTAKNIRILEPLTRPEIMSVLEAAGLTHPNSLVHQILNQAEGRPGLAITLAYVCLEGDERDLEKVIFGNALIRSVRTTFESLVGPFVIELLAAFAIGGRAGMSIQVVADYLGKSPADIRLAITRLSAGGVVSDVDGLRLSVRPPELGYGLIRDVFFSGATSLAIIPLLANVPNFPESIETLAHASHYGAPVPMPLMERLLEQADSHAAWESYAWLGPDQARFVICRHPELIGSLAQPALQHTPEVAVPLLLNGSIGDNRPLHSHPDHCLRQIQEWIKGGWPGTGEPIRRRESLLESAVNWLNSGRDVGVGLRAISIAFSPNFESHSSDPVLGDKITFRFGVLPLQEIEKITMLWPRAICAIRAVQASKAATNSGWQHVVSLVSDWAFPQRHTTRELPDDLCSRIREFAAEMLRDLVDLGRESCGLMHRASELANELGITLEGDVDSDFEVLFPTIPNNWSEFLKVQSIAIKQLAERWALQQPRSVVERINQLEAQAIAFGNGNRQVPFLAAELAERTSNPVEWIESILDANAKGDLVSPFLVKSSTLAATGWEDAALRCLSQDATRFATASVILSLHEPPSIVLEAALRSLKGMSKQVEFQCSQDLVPLETVRRLLTHEDDEVASHAAVGCWVAVPKGTVPEAIQADWTIAVLRGNPREYWIGQIFKEHPHLGFEYLRKEVRNKLHYWSLHDDVMRDTLRSLSADQRRDLLVELPDGFSSSDMVAMLIGSDCDAYRALLSTARLKRHHTAPLRGRPNEGNWTERATIALDAGITPEDVAASAFPTIVSWAGKESEMWNGWSEAFQTIRSCDDERVREVASHGLEIANSRRDRAVKQERAEETYGRP